jgi:hypothetical protein
LNSSVTVIDDDITESRVEIVLDSTLVGYITRDFANLQTIAINDSTISTISGPLQLAPVGNDKVRLLTSSAMRLPIGITASRPVFADIGDLRYNTNLGTIEWYDGDDWKQPLEGPYGIQSQILLPNGVTAVFTLNQNATSEGVMVSINGVTQQPGVAYNVVANQITFTETPLTSDSIEIRFLTTNIATLGNPIVTDSSYIVLTGSPQVIDSFYALHYRSAKYTYSAKNTGSNRFETGEINLVHDGFTPYFNVRYVGNQSPSIISWTAAIDPFGVMNLSASSALTGTNIKLHRMYFSDLT